MSARHTAGPWFIYDGRADNDAWREGLTIGSTPMGTRVCDVSALRDKPSRDADARLIAAAPDLLAACDALLNLWLGGSGFDSDTDDRVEAQARAAIARATGAA